MATPAIATAMADEKLGASWQSVPFDLYARMGMVKLIQGDGPAASDIFNKAIPLAPSHATKEAMNRLGDAAKAGQAVIPEDVGGKVDPSKTSADRAVMALSAGILYHVIGQDDLAEGLFERISKDQSLRASSAQLAFANYGIYFIRGCYDSGFHNWVNSRA